MAYVVEARDLAETPEYRAALAVLIFKWEGIFFNRARRRIEASCTRAGTTSVDEEAADIVAEAFKDVFGSVERFEGAVAPQFHKFVQTIVDRRVIDWFRARDGAPRIEAYDGTVSEVSEERGLYEVVPDHGTDIEKAVELRLLWERALEDESERDAFIVGLKAEGYSAQEVVTMVEDEGLDRGEGITTDNVDTIYSRFKKKNRELFLEEMEVEEIETADREGGSADGQG